MGLALCIDQGNSSTKIGVFDNDVLLECSTFTVFGIAEADQLLKLHNFEACILSSVTHNVLVIEEYLKHNIKIFISLNAKTSIPIQNNYLNPETLGKDRLAAVVGAVYLKPKTDLLVIDAGTAITYDFVDSENVYHGGNIAPGIDMRLRALHEFTQKLPLVEASAESELLGNSTQTAILSGVMQGVDFEIKGYINSLKIKYPELSVFLTGGSTFYILAKIKNAIFAEKNLVLIGLNRILQFNVQK